MKRKLVPVLAGLLSLLLAVSASACTLFFFGGDYTDDGASLFLRIEDGDLNDENKLYLVTPAGRFRAGEEYHSPVGFTWTFTHDSYRYVSRADDLPREECPVCGEIHDQTYFQEAGTNEHGLTLTATQSLDALPAVQAVDPYNPLGLYETDIPTILLSECASAREAVALLKSIVETTGVSYECFGMMICDQQEQWYAEVLSAHYMLAARLPRSVAFGQLNVSVFGRMDLDDTENLVVTDGLIALTQRAGTFVGDEAQNVIDIRRSLNDYTVTVPAGVELENVRTWRWIVQTRMARSLQYLTGRADWTANEAILEDNPYILTNIGEDGAVVPLRNDLRLNGTVSLDYLLEMIRIYPIGYSENVEEHIYRFYPDADTELGTVEWSAMDNCKYTVFIPGYPVLLTDTWEGYRKKLPDAELVTEKPDTRECYEMHGVYFAGYSIRDWRGLWHVLPEGWQESYSATFSAMSNYLTYCDPGEDARELAVSRLYGLQQYFVSRFSDLTARLEAEPSTEARQEIMTREHAEMSEEAHGLALALYRYFVYGEESERFRLGTD